jgi:dihydroorotate dehydrogenase electron transfer subunit
MRIFCPGIASRAKPGQFVMVRVNQLLDPLLRRPFGIHGLYREKDSCRQKNHPSCIEILYRIAGKGTRVLSERKRGEEIDLLGPLGNGFCLGQNIKTAIMVAGGIGVAPLFSLAQTLKEVEDNHTEQIEIIILLGGETGKDILCLKEFKKLGSKVEVSTNDGSLGAKGVVTNLLSGFLGNFTPSESHSVQLFGCGPLPMLKALSELALSQDLPCQVSLESRMACGVGACLGCSVPIVLDKRGSSEALYQRVCKEGPVFDSTVIQWDETIPL